VKIDVIVMNNTTVRFRIKDDRMRSRVLRRGMWNLRGVPVVLSKWTPIADMEQEEVKTIPLWVIVKNVPPKYFSWKVLKAITSPLGVPQKLHPDTEACKSFEEAKVLVEVDLTNKLPKLFSFKSETCGDTIVEFVYPWLPPRCTDCNKWGHQTSDCLIGKKKNIETKSAEKEVTEEKSGEKKNVAEEGKKQQVLESKDTENNGNELEVVKGSNNEWSTPTKVGRSPVNKKELRFGEVSLLTNTFSCLSDKEEGEEEGEITISGDEKLHESQPEGKEEQGLDTQDTTPKEVAEIKNSVQREVEEVMIRQSLPRASKEEHKFLSTNATQSNRTNNPIILKKSRPKKF